MIKSTISAKLCHITLSIFKWKMNIICQIQIKAATVRNHEFKCLPQQIFISVTKQKNVSCPLILFTKWYKWLFNNNKSRCSLKYFSFECFDIIDWIKLIFHLFYDDLFSLHYFFVIENNMLKYCKKICHPFTQYSQTMKSIHTGYGSLRKIDS